MKVQKVGVRLAGLVVLFSSILIVICSLGLYQQTRILGDLQEIYHERLKPLNAIGKIAEVLKGDVVEILSAFQHDPDSPLSKLHDHPVTLHLQNIEKNRRAEADDWKKYTASQMDEAEAKLASEFEALMIRYRADVIEPAVKAIEKGDFSNDRIGEFQRARLQVANQLSALTRQLAGIQEDQSQKSYDSAVSDYERARILVLSLTTLGIVLGVLGAVLIIRSVTRPLALMRNALVHTQETGDFTKEVPVQRQDEVGQAALAFNDLQSEVRKTFGELNRSIYEVSQSARDMAGNSEESSKAASDTSESTSAMAAAVEEMTVSINHVGESSKNALSIAKEAGALSTQGNEVIHKAVSEINKIAETVKRVSEEINQLGERSDNISSVIQVIREVADQTNLLALNAAIEAARAGETGRGFAVVADEVRKLAERTATATSEISQMITEIQESAKGAVHSMASAVLQVDSGVALAKDAGEAITRIYESTEHVVQLVDGISDAIVEQASASNSISTQVERVAQAAEETSASSRTASDSARHLEALSERMKKAAAAFQV